MQSAVEIANTALMRIGVSRFIESLSSATNEAQIVRRVYDMTRRRTLRRLPWAFAREFRKLALTTNTSERWNYVYAYPSDALRIFDVGTPEFQKFECFSNPMPYQTTTKGSERVVCTDVAGAYALIVKDVTDTSLFDPMYEDYLIWELAKDIAGPLSVNASLVEIASRSAELAFFQASEASNAERRDNRKPMNEFVRARL